MYLSLKPGETVRVGGLLITLPRDQPAVKLLIGLDVVKLADPRRDTERATEARRH